MVPGRFEVERVLESSSSVRSDVTCRIVGLLRVMAQVCIGFCSLRELGGVVQAWPWFLADLGIACASMGLTVVVMCEMFVALLTVMLMLKIQRLGSIMTVCGYVLLMRVQALPAVSPSL